MNIGYLRLGLPIELNLQTASVNMLGTEIRAGLLRSWSEDSGFKTTLFTPIPQKDLEWLRKGEEGWTKELSYSPVALPNNQDVLFVEMGVSNTLFSYKEGKHEVSLVERTLECLNAFEGKVIYYQHGIIPFPFQTKLPKGHESELNLKKLFAKYDVFKNKEWTVLHHFMNEAEFSNDKHYDAVRDRLKFKYLPLGYNRHDPMFAPKQNPMWDCLFIGSQWDSASKSQGQKRFDEISEFYDTDKYQAAIIGKWEAETVKGFKHAQYLGQLGKHADAYSFWNDSYSCIWTTSQKIKNLGLIPTRPIMVIRSGALCLADRRIHNVQWVIDDKYIVDDSEMAKFRIDEYKNMGLAERQAVNRQQLNKFPEWKDVNWSSIFGG